MRVLIVFESMFGNTHVIARCIADGMATESVTIVAAARATPKLVEEADLVVVGSPTHHHGLPRPDTRAAAIETAIEAGSEPWGTPHVEHDAYGPGLREWFETLGARSGLAAAFDTRYDGPPLVTGRASKDIAHRLRHHGFRLVAEPHSFLVEHEHHLLPHECEKAHAWGTSLVELAKAKDRRLARR